MRERRAAIGKVFILVTAIAVVASLCLSVANARPIDRIAGSVDRVSQDAEARVATGPNPPCAPTPRDPPWPIPHCRPGEEPPPPPACSDGEDNDGDDLIDEDDPGCTGPEDDDETDPVVDTCSDEIDNDDDGLTDGDDPECQDPEDGVEDGSDAVEPTCGDPDGDGVDHSNFDPEADETGTISAIGHEVDQGLPAPAGGDGGVVTEVNCALIAGFLGQ